MLNYVVFGVGIKMGFCRCYFNVWWFLFFGEDVDGDSVRFVVWFVFYYKVLVDCFMYVVVMGMGILFWEKIDERRGIIRGWLDYVGSVFDLGLIVILVLIGRRNLKLGC